MIVSWARLARLAIAYALVATAACGSSTPTSPTPSPGQTPQPAPAPAPAPQPNPTPAPAPAPPPVPVVTIAAGEHRVGIDVQPGRYFADPSTGCYWERRTPANSPTPIASATIDFDAAQWVVDIRASDAIFETRPACGTWFNTQRQTLQSSIPPGVWIVGQQVTPGLYQTSAGPGCHWQRLRHFGGEPDAVIASDLVGSASVQFVTINSTDAGFRSDAACGAWVRAQSSSNPSALSR
jgi:hypothetical protein